jgi:hypothetical protein
MRSTTAQKPATTPIPVQLSATEFTAFIFPYLSMPKRGPQGKLVVFGRNNPSPYTVNGRPLYVHLNGLAIVLLK